MVSRAQGCCSTFQSVQAGPPQPGIIHNVNGVGDEEPLYRASIYTCHGQEKQCFEPNDLKKNTSKVNK